jgi:hypothetical protein
MNQPSRNWHTLILAGMGSQARFFAFTKSGGLSTLGAAALYTFAAQNPDFQIGVIGAAQY